MMKKLTVLMLVLGMACVANASIAGLAFTVGGQVKDDGSTITLSPSGTVELDMELLVGHTIKGYKIDYLLTNAQAEMIRTSMVFPAIFDGMGKVLTNPVPTAQHFQISGGQLTSPPLNGPQDLMHGLILHCLDTTPVDLIIKTAGSTVIDGVTYGTGIVLHTLHITQVPEPATMLLLGIGGLFLRRRKKQ